jgi:hypothetical protein
MWCGELGVCRCIQLMCLHHNSVLIKNPLVILRRGYTRSHTEPGS